MAAEPFERNNREARVDSDPRLNVQRGAALLVKMVSTVGLCRSGLCYRVDRRIASEWIEKGKAIAVFDTTEAKQNTTVGAVTSSGESAQKVPRKRRRRRRKH